MPTGTLSDIDQLDKRGVLDKRAASGHVVARRRRAPITPNAIRYGRTIIPRARTASDDHNIRAALHVQNLLLE